MNIPATTVLDNELASLAKTKGELLASIETAQSRLAEIDIQVRTIERIRGQLARVERRGSDDDSPGASEAVLDYVRHHPRCQANQIVEAVAPIIKTKAEQRDRLIYNTVLQQIKRGRIVRGGKDDRELTLAEKSVDRNGHDEDTE